MKEYELMIEDINPCGGATRAKKEFFDIATDSPEAYVLANARYPIMEQYKSQDGNLVIATGNGKGNLVRYTFVE